MHIFFYSYFFICFIKFKSCFSSLKRITLTWLWLGEVEAFYFRLRTEAYKSLITNEVIPLGMGFFVFVRISKIVCSITKADVINWSAGISSGIYIGKRSTRDRVIEAALWLHMEAGFSSKSTGVVPRKALAWKPIDSVRLALDRITSAVIHFVVRNWWNSRRGYSNRVLKRDFTNNTVYCY